MSLLGKLNDGLDALQSLITGDSHLSISRSDTAVTVFLNGNPVCGMVGAVEDDRIVCLFFQSDAIRRRLIRRKG